MSFQVRTLRQTGTTERGKEKFKILSGMKMFKYMESFIFFFSDFFRSGRKEEDMKGVLKILDLDAVSNEKLLSGRRAGNQKI